MMQDEMTGLYCDGTEKTRSLRPSCKIKICGLSRPEDIRAANRILPDYIGFVFAESSRRITVSQAVRLNAALDPRIRAVGVFVNAPINLILSLAAEAHGVSAGPVIDLIQLHGDEDASYIRELKSKTRLPVIKAVRVRTFRDIESAQSLPCDYLLYDTWTKDTYGGSGSQFDWSLIPPDTRPFFLAGGITLQTIPRAVSSGACCIDISSAVETEGRKDERKMREAVGTVREQ